MVCAGDAVHLDGAEPIGTSIADQNLLVMAGQGGNRFLDHLIPGAIKHVQWGFEQVPIGFVLAQQLPIGGMRKVRRVLVGGFQVVEQWPLSQLGQQSHQFGFRGIASVVNGLQGWQEFGFNDRLGQLRLLEMCLIGKNGQCQNGVEPRSVPPWAGKVQQAIECGIRVAGCGSREGRTHRDVFRLQFLQKAGGVQPAL